MDSLPSTHRALVQRAYAQRLAVEEVSTPQVTPGSAVLRIQAGSVISYQKEVYNGSRKYPYPTPLVTGLWAIGRVVATGSDAVALQPGQLVFFDSFIRARDDPSIAMLSGLSNCGMAAKLMEGEWRDSTFAQFARVPLENCHRLDENRLCRSMAEGGLGYSQEQLTWAGMALVGYGGLRSVGLQAGETVICGPATGPFGAAAALVAAAMGARVIAMGRNTQKLQRLAAMSPRIHTAPITGDHETEMQELAAFGQIDIYLDLSPPQATSENSTYFKSAVKSLRRGGRVSLMGGQGGELALPSFHIVSHDITIRGQLMYSAEIARDLVKLIETGVLSLGDIHVAGRFDLSDWEKAFDTAANMAFDEVTVLAGW